MKKLLVVFLSVLLCLNLIACDLSFDKDGGEITTNLTKLPTPVIKSVENDYVFWEEVPNASSYIVKINDYQESAGNQLKYSIASVMDSRVEENTPTELHIYIKAKGNQVLYSDSEWSKEITYTYTKVSSEGKVQVGFKDVYKSNGLGRTIDLISADSYKPKSGVGYIFDESALFHRTLLEETIRDQKATYEYGTSFDSFYSKWKFDIGAKVAKNDLGIDGMNFMPGSADFNIEVKGGYEQVRKEETKELYIKMHHNIVGKSVEIIGHASDYNYYASILSDNFKNAARQVTDDKTAEKFIAAWGTHVIMAAYYGAAFEASYYNISHDKYSEDNWYTDIEAAVKARLFFSDLNVNLNFDLDRDSNDNSKTSLTKFEAYAVGGNGVALASDLASFQSAYETWANGLTEENYTLIDFPENSLYCIWDFLDDSYASQKAILDNYLVSRCNEKFDAIKFKVSKLYADKETVDDDSSKLYGGGSGMAGDPYIISNARHLHNIRLNPSSNFKIVSDIDLSDYKWTPVPEFSGCLNGNNHGIKNMSVSVPFPDYTKMYTGFIAENNGQISNLNFQNYSVTAFYEENRKTKMHIQAGLVGINRKDAVIKNVTVSNSAFDATLKFKTDKANMGGNLLVDVGGIAGENYGVISYCKSTNNTFRAITDTMFNTCNNYSVAGGVVGTNYGEINNVISFHNDLYTYSNGGYYMFLEGSGNLRCWSGYVCGNNNGGKISYTLSYGHELESMVVEANDFAAYTGVNEYAGLISGNDIGSTTYSDVYSQSVGTMQFFGSKSGYSDFVRSDIEYLLKIVKLWSGWEYDIESATFTFNIK